MLCLLSGPRRCAVPFQLRRGTLLVCAVPRRRELGHQLVLRAGTHPLHLDLEERNAKHGPWLKLSIPTMQYPQTQLRAAPFGFVCSSEPEHLWQTEQKNRKQSANLDFPHLSFYLGFLMVLPSLDLDLFSLESGEQKSTR